MKYHTSFVTLLAVVLLALSSVAEAAKEGNWKRGRIYYRMVCTDCHIKEAGGKIPPAEKTKAEWADYFARNLHGPQDAAPKFAASYFVSREYRDSIKDTNRAAAKLLEVPDEQLLEDVKAFVIHAAKDSDQPARCE